MTQPVRCPRCRVVMETLPGRLDLSPPAASARRADLPFRGILADVFQCPSCLGIGTVPAGIDAPTTRLEATA